MLAQSSPSNDDAKSNNLSGVILWLGHWLATEYVSTQSCLWTQWLRHDDAAAQSPPSIKTAGVKEEIRGSESAEVQTSLPEISNDFEVCI